MSEQMLVEGREQEGGKVCYKWPERLFGEETCDKVLKNVNELDLGGRWPQACPAGEKGERKDLGVSGTLEPPGQLHPVCWTRQETGRPRLLHSYHIRSI